MTYPTKKQETYYFLYFILRILLVYTFTPWWWSTLPFCSCMFIVRNSTNQYFIATTFQDMWNQWVFKLSTSTMVTLFGVRSFGHSLIFECWNLQVIPENENRALYSTHSFKILFKEGGCGTFIPLFFNLINSVRRYNQQAAPAPEPRVDPLRAAQTPVDEMMRHA